MVVWWELSAFELYSWVPLSRKNSRCGAILYKAVVVAEYFLEPCEIAFVRNRQLVHKPFCFVVGFVIVRYGGSLSLQQLAEFRSKEE